MKTRKALISVKGQMKNPFYQFLGKTKAKLYGLDKIDFNENPQGHIEVFVEGEREKIWDIINWAKRGNVYLILDEVTFRFKDLS